MLPNGVEPADWRVDPVARDPREVVVVSVMRLEPRKRPMALLRMVRAARQTLPPGVRLRLVLVGEGPLRARVERTLRRHGMAADVELPGRLDRAGIRELYRRADVYIAPATLESFGIAALEARCAGLPVLARSRTGIADFIADGVEGLLARNDRALAGELARVAADAELRERLTEHNRSVRPEAGWGEVLQTLRARVQGGRRALPRPPGAGPALTVVPGPTRRRGTRPRRRPGRDGGATVAGVRPARRWRTPGPTSAGPGRRPEPVRSRRGWHPSPPGPGCARRIRSPSRPA